MNALARQLLESPNVDAFLADVRRMGHQMDHVLILNDFESPTIVLRGFKDRPH